MKSSRQPKLRCHKHTNRAYVVLCGKTIYLGQWGSPEAQKQYHLLLAEWNANGKRLAVDPQELTIAELCAAYLQHAKQYYRHSDGSSTSQIYQVKSALKTLHALFGELAAVQFGPLKLHSLRDEWIQQGLCRNSCNKLTACIKLMFRWGASHEMIPGKTYTDLSTLVSLRAGRSDAKETDPIQPVSEADVERTLPFLSRQVAALVQLQLLCGTRPGELLCMRPCDLDMSQPVWTMTLVRHKNTWRGKPRTIFFGPQAQAILKKWLLRPADTFCFSPQEAETDRYAQMNTHRHQPVKSPTTKRRVGTHYTTASYSRAIKYGCQKVREEAEKNGKPLPGLWTPLQLRHTAATRIRAEFGIQAAQVILGHSELSVTEVYAEVDAAKAREIASKIG